MKSTPSRKLSFIAIEIEILYYVSKVIRGGHYKTILVHEIVIISGTKILFTSDNNKYLLLFHSNLWHSFLSFFQMVEILLLFCTFQEWAYHDFRPRDREVMWSTFICINFLTSFLRTLNDLLHHLKQFLLLLVVFNISCKMLRFQKWDHSITLFVRFQRSSHSRILMCIILNNSITYLKMLKKVCVTTNLLYYSCLTLLPL